jgi:hypothetical protein
MQGRILFYNPQTGEGKLITQAGEKLNFTAEIWDDFEAMPEVGLSVECRIEGNVLKSVGTAVPEEKKSKKNKHAENDGDAKTQIKSDRSTFSVIQTLESYFKPIDYLIGDPPPVVNTAHQLDYFLIRRFLMTAYNDLRSLDSTLHRAPEVTEKLDEIQQLFKAYLNVRDRVEKYRLAFEMIFLRSQPEYLRFIRHKEQCLNRIGALSQMEESLFPDIKKKEDAMKKLGPEKADQRQQLEEELKKLRRHYVDAIHENAGLAEELTTMEDVKGKYTELYYEEFVRELLQQASAYLKTLGKILNYRAFEFDQLMWKHAANSKSIREYFANSGIKGEYSTLTFLRYYLRSLDKEKAGEEQKELFKLQAYLEKKRP